MSTRALNWVWDLEDLGPSETLVMLALADQANDAGVAWPAQGTLARRSRQTDRNVRRMLVKLERLGLLSVDRRSSVQGRRSNRYRLHIGNHPGESLEPQQEDNLSGSSETGRDSSEQDLSDDPVSVGTAARGQSVRLRKRTICPVAQPDTDVRLLPIKDEPPDLTRPDLGESPSPANPTPGRVRSGQPRTDQGPSSPGSVGGREETPPGDAGGEPVGNVPPARQAPGSARSETRRLLKVCLPEHLRALDASGARQVAALLDGRLAAGWRPDEIRSLMDQPLPPRVHRLSALVAARLRANVDPALAPGRPDGCQAEAQRQEAARRRSEELAGTVREADPVREAAEAGAWERARREAPPGASRLELARRVNEILAEDGRPPGAPGRGREAGRARGVVS